MKVLIVGGGGREHALAWKAAQSSRVGRVFVAPGNAGTAREEGVENVDIGAEAIDALQSFAQTNAVDLTIVGPEAPLVDGIVDRFQAAGLRIFGPNQAAAQLEGSKAFTKDFLARHKIPTAAYQSFTELDEAERYVREQGAPIVVKADGLAAGKGVILAQSEDEAICALREIMSDKKFGDAGDRVVVEEFLQGEEASFITIVGGGEILPMASSQDHKPRDDGDTGPNTGGMGAYSPAPVVTDVIHRRVMEEVIEPTVRGMQSEGNPYTGFLYAGLMIDGDGTPKVLEYNCRFGDPETQPILMRLQSDLVDMCDAALDGTLATTETRWDSRACVGVVMAAGGYPANYRKGDPIAGLEAELADTKVFHAGTSVDADQVVTNGGRVLCVCGLGESVGQAQSLAYQRIQAIQWRDAYYRRDIGYRAVDREAGDGAG